MYNLILNYHMGLRSSVFDSE